MLELMIVSIAEMRGALIAPESRSALTRERMIVRATRAAIAGNIDMMIMREIVAGMVEGKGSTVAMQMRGSGETDEIRDAFHWTHVSGLGLLDCFIEGEAY